MEAFNYYYWEGQKRYRSLIIHTLITSGGTIDIKADYFWTAKAAMCKVTDANGL
jgi:hypothetical protein